MRKQKSGGPPNALPTWPLLRGSRRATHRPVGLVCRATWRPVLLAPRLPPARSCLCRSQASREPHGASASLSVCFRAIRKARLGVPERWVLKPSLCKAGEQNTARDASSYLLATICSQANATATRPSACAAAGWVCVLPRVSGGCGGCAPDASRVGSISLCATRRGRFVVCDV